MLDEPALIVRMRELSVFMHRQLWFCNPNEASFEQVDL
jgi:hypothetical protein